MIITGVCMKVFTVIYISYRIERMEFPENSFDNETVGMKGDRLLSAVIFW